MLTHRRVNGRRYLIDFARGPLLRVLSRPANPARIPVSPSGRWYNRSGAQSCMVRRAIEGDFRRTLSTLRGTKDVRDLSTSFGSRRSYRRSNRIALLVPKLLKVLQRSLRLLIKGLRILHRNALRH
jgi:hypothetical protein